MNQVITCLRVIHIALILYIHGDTARRVNIGAVL